ncbi:MAG: bifunctional [glutamate--ammonia ligase]-adenylyl-L-tyrosine phosphorylase/[glutamate--ammonia-ligase] adenylyltransferase [Thiomargarita sp.]|nr:bifunctional [glutamate--ammonia ligase]-adenylyl-L-tyrosine phosphorylase/[glutamate--ammonia-ligase] adenylyltransferase [Thiomargarita sp.]
MDISKTFSKLPPLLQPEVARFWLDYQTKANPENIALLAKNTRVFDSLPKVWACSVFAAKTCVQLPDILANLLTTGDLLKVPNNYPEKLAELLKNVETEAELMRVLRLFRYREMLRIAWRDLSGWATLEESLASLSNLADAIMDVAVTWLYKQLTIKLGTPCDTKGTPQLFIVLALGKLGGQELNFSSDIDLIFAYPEAGETIGVKRPRDNQSFFIRLGQQLIQVLNNITSEGFIYRVDMRLRPFGDSGPLVMSFAALEGYYEAHARDWERYALVKARVAAGDKIMGEELLKTLRPFVYRRYLDFNAFESLRNMKKLIDQETSRKGLNNNIKLGAGGIREIEFTCQVFQLIRGGQQPALQQRHLLTVLKKLEQYQIIEQETASNLRQAYHFLRLTENHLQAIDDTQTQTLASDVLNQTRLSYSMGFTSWNDFIARLNEHQQKVHTKFGEVISPKSVQPSTKQNKETNNWEALWLEGLTDELQVNKLLKQANFKQVDHIFTRLQQFTQSRTMNKLTQRAREKLDILIPLLIVMAAEQKYCDDALIRSLNLLESVSKRSVYLSLLVERPQVLKQLVYLCAESAWIAEQITRYPLLLDELIDPRHLYEPLKPAELENVLQAQLAHLPIDDLDMQMDGLRQFKRAYVLHVAAAELSNNLIVETASDYLSTIADILVRQALNIAYYYLSNKHGKPNCNLNSADKNPGLCIVAYGKAGGIELSYSSDLDIVFLHDGCQTQQFTDGNKPLNNETFFSRLGQRIIHIITTRTPAGILYEVDSRLRPGGASSVLVTNFDAFEAYQHKNAWTWEHQALIRARAIAGNPHSIERFEKIRRDILTMPRNSEILKIEVREMRDKMRQKLDKTTTKDNLFDLKQGDGGIIDIEFIVQYIVLHRANKYTSLLETTGTLPLLKRFEKHQLLDKLACSQLSTAFRCYRAEIHRLALQNKLALVKHNIFDEQCQQVRHWWITIMQ